MPNKRKFENVTVVIGTWLDPYNGYKPSDKPVEYTSDSGWIGYLWRSMGSIDIDSQSGKASVMGSFTQGEFDVDTLESIELGKFQWSLKEEV